MKTSQRRIVGIWITALLLALQPALAAGLLRFRADAPARDGVWMGLYMEGTKVGYSRLWEGLETIAGRKFRKKTSETSMKVSRLGGLPVEIRTVEENYYDEEGRPFLSRVVSKLAESETVQEAEVRGRTIVFKMDGRVIEEKPVTEEFYFGIPMDRILDEKSLAAGKSFTFPILDFLSRSLVESRFDVIGREETVILGRTMNLWHVRTEVASAIPVTVEDWIDDSGETWKSVSRASFLTTTSIRMDRDKALEPGTENFDIAFSTVIRSNVLIENPQQVRSMTVSLGGVPVETIEAFPFDDGSQEIVEVENGSVLLKTTSLIVRQAEAAVLPIQDPALDKFLKPTVFCQSDDPDIVRTARSIVGEERNSWRAAKALARWVGERMTPNYDVGFASAREVLRNMSGDCSEHTVLAVALCRAAGIPARAAVGIMYARGIFAYHMWPEVYVGRWVGLDAKWPAMDAETGEMFTDATHIKFGRSSLDENIFAEMATVVSKVIGSLEMEILDYQPGRRK